MEQVLRVCVSVNVISTILQKSARTCLKDLKICKNLQFCMYEKICKENTEYKSTKRTIQDSKRFLNVKLQRNQMLFALSLYLCSFLLAWSKHFSSFPFPPKKLFKEWHKDLSKLTFSHSLAFIRSGLILLRSSVHKFFNSEKIR